MNNFNIIFIGFYTLKTFTQIAVLKDDRGAKPESLGKMNTNKSSFIKLARQLQSKYPKTTLHLLSWPVWVLDLPTINQFNHCCDIVAPSLIPKKSGNRVKDLLWVAWLILLAIFYSNACLILRPPTGIKPFFW